MMLLLKMLMLRIGPEVIHRLSPDDAALPVAEAADDCEFLAFDTCLLLIVSRADDDGACTDDALPSPEPETLPPSAADTACLSIRCCGAVSRDETRPEAASD